MAAAALFEQFGEGWTPVWWPGVRGAEAGYTGSSGRGTWAELARRVTAAMFARSSTS